MPKNAPGIVVLPPTINVVRDATDMSFTVKSPAGDPQEVMVEPELFGTFLLRPTTALNEGRYTVKYLNVCDYWQAANQYKEQTVNVGPAVELPKKIATSATGTFEHQALCYPIRGQIKVEVELTPEMKAYREIAKFSVAWGDRAVQTSFGDYGVTTSQRPSFFLPAPECQKGQAAVSGLLTISAHVAGAGFDPVSFVTPLSVPCPYAGVELTDPKKVPECTAMPTTILDAGVANVPDALGPVQPKNDADVGTPAMENEPSSGMCSYSNSRSSAPFGLFIGLAMALRMGWKRRRGNPRTRRC
jgi:hypothetical protein